MPYHSDCLNGAKFIFIFDIISFLFQPPIFFSLEITIMLRLSLFLEKPFDILH